MGTAHIFNFTPLIWAQKSNLDCLRNNSTILWFYNNTTSCCVLKHWFVFLYTFMYPSLSIFDCYLQACHLVYICSIKHMLFDTLHHVDRFLFCQYTLIYITTSSLMSKWIFYPFMENTRKSLHWLFAHYFYMKLLFWMFFSQSSFIP